MPALGQGSLGACGGRYRPKETTEEVPSKVSGRESIASDGLTLLPEN